jgi:Transcription factor zinc-finger
MKCPVCTDTDLLMAERQGVEIDYCSSCRGVWLDRGELDKIIERANAESASSSAGAEPRDAPPIILATTSTTSIMTTAGTSSATPSPRRRRAAF